MKWSSVMGQLDAIRTTSYVELQEFFFVSRCTLHDGNVTIKLKFVGNWAISK